MTASVTRLRPPRVSPWLSLSDVRGRIELDEAFDEVLRAPVDCFVVDSDDEPHETLPPPPVAPVRSALWQPVRPVKTRWYP